MQNVYLMDFQTCIMLLEYISQACAKGGGAYAPPDFGRSEGAAGSGGAPPYFTPPRFLDFDTCLITSLFWCGQPLNCVAGFALVVSD